MPELILGSPPRGEDYFGRKQLIDRLWSRLATDHVLLAAPRRFGKTGAMYRLLDAPREPFRPVYVDVEDITSAPDFMVELMAALLRDRHFSKLLRGFWQGTKELGGFLRNLPQTIDLGGLKIELREKTEVETRWETYGNQVLELLAGDGPSLLLMIDEFAIMASSIQQRQGQDQVAKFLRWFRKARQMPDSQTRFLLGSSINLVSTLDGMGLVDTINDLAVERLQPFSLPTAKKYVRAIFASKDQPLTPELESAVLDLVGAPIPYLLAVLLTALFERQRATGEEISPQTLQAAFDEDLLGGATAAVFHHYRSRLDVYYTQEEARAAKAILGTLARADGPVGLDTLYRLYVKACGLSEGPEHSDRFMQLMNKLENDFYVALEEGQCRFYSRVLGAWWRARYGFLGV